jgi:amino acid efflux transporter
MTMQRHQRSAPGGLRRRQAIPLAIGSIAGSGILFLPSAVYVEAGRNSLLVWALSTLVCLPMLLMFEDMVRATPDGGSIQAFIGAGLGDVAGRCCSCRWRPSACRPGRWSPAATSPARWALAPA